jgi:hypothetical protein
MDCACDASGSPGWLGVPRYRGLVRGVFFFFFLLQVEQRNLQIHESTAL